MTADRSCECDHGLTATLGRVLRAPDTLLHIPPLVLLQALISFLKQMLSLFLVFLFCFVLLC